MTKMFARDRYQKAVDKAESGQYRYASDLQREASLSLARGICDLLADEEAVTEVRQRVESHRMHSEAYGTSWGTHDYVMTTLEMLADTLREQPVRN